VRRGGNRVGRACFENPQWVAGWGKRVWWRAPGAAAKFMMLRAARPCVACTRWPALRLQHCTCSTAPVPLAEEPYGGWCACMPSATRHTPPARPKPGAQQSCSTHARPNRPLPHTPAPTLVIRSSMFFLAKSLANRPGQ